jgi:2-polyprenyl-3-methyl-5-hydroxy-6-metoxy-1,4-benzoquinol methylase
MTTDEFKYIGDELSLFQHAKTWKNYVSARIKPYLKGVTLEAGAGNGANINFLLQSDISRYVALEPDPQLCETMRGRSLDEKVEVRCGTTEDMKMTEFDTIIYYDVTEHIEDDQAEVKRAINLLKPGGHLIIIGPAHNFLYSNFDREIGHFRRYNLSMLRALMTSNMKEIRAEYLDSVGMALSMTNRLFLKQSYPTLKQILFWDRCVVPISRIVDPILGRRLGKSFVGVFAKN